MHGNQEENREVYALVLGLVYGMILGLMLAQMAYADIRPCVWPLCGKQPQITGR